MLSPINDPPALSTNYPTSKGEVLWDPQQWHTGTGWTESRGNWERGEGNFWSEECKDFQLREYVCEKAYWAFFFWQVTVCIWLFIAVKCVTRQNHPPPFLYDEKVFWAFLSGRWQFACSFLQGNAWSTHSLQPLHWCRFFSCWQNRAIPFVNIFTCNCMQVLTVSSLKN